MLFSGANDRVFRLVFEIPMTISKPKIIKRKPKYITIAEFCRINQLDKTTVRDAIKDARILSVKCNKMGRVVGMQNNKCLVEYRANTDQSMAMRTKIPKAAELEGEVIDYMVERAKREKFMAKTAEVEYLKEIGELVSAQEARVEAHEIAVRLKNNVFGLATKHSQKLTGITDPLRVDLLLRTELTKIFNDFSTELSGIAGGETQRR